MNKYSIKDWEKHFINAGVRKEIIDIYMLYIKYMYKKKAPPIFEFEHLANMLGRTKKYLASVVNCPESYYRTFMIPKRNGGVRRIDAPYPALLECQRWINHNILSKLSLHLTTHGFRKKNQY